jgi:hypothetical protein
VVDVEECELEVRRDAVRDEQAVEDSDEPILGLRGGGPATRAVEIAERAYELR